MRPDCTWSMSTAGLTAQEIYLPAESPFLFPGGSYCHSMAGSKSSWTSRQELDNYWSPGTVAPSLSFERQKHRGNTSEDDQVVPSFQRLSVYEPSSPPQTPGRCAKPLPPLPLPGQTDLSTDQAMDNEVEFFTSSDDSRCLVPEQQCNKPSAFRYGIPSRRSFGCGQINYAYFEGSTAGQPKQQQQQPRQQEVREPPEKQPPEPLEPPLAVRQQERAQRKLRRSHSGPAGSFNKPTSFRLHRYTHGYTQAMDKPEVPPRIPIPPRPPADYRRWSAEVSSGAYSDEDRPPKVPPRDHLSQGSSRTPSPKSLPMYLNGVMPPTQSFAPDPKYYVSRGLQRQNSEGSPCILPVMENGVKSSTTHYFLLPERPAYLVGGQGPASDWDCQTRRKTHVDIV